MQSFKFRLSRTVRTASVLDLRSDAQSQVLAEIARKARAFASRNKTCGKLAVFA